MPTPETNLFEKTLERAAICFSGVTTELPSSWWKKELRPFFEEVVRALPSGTVSEREAVLRERAAYLKAREHPSEGCGVMRREGRCQYCESDAENQFPLPDAPSHEDRSGSVSGAVSEEDDHA